MPWSSCQECKLFIGILALLTVSSSSNQNASVLLKKGKHEKKNYCTDEVLTRFPGWPKELDTSIYWFGANDESEKATGQASKFYDPSKPTLIFIPGWEYETINICWRLTSEINPDVSDNRRILATAWVEKGWNFGIFYWDQFSDKMCAMDPETDIWGLHEDDSKGLAWRSYDPVTKKEEMRYHTAHKSVGAICADEVRRSMPNFAGPSIRFAGHSLGGQLAIKCAQLLHQESPQGLQPLPSRLALLDPYFSILSIALEAVYARWCWKSIPKRRKLNKVYPRYIPHLASSGVSELWQKGVVSELYKTSLLTETRALGDAVLELETMSTLTILHPAFCYGHAMPRIFGMECQHCAAAPLYFMRMDGADLGTLDDASLQNLGSQGDASSQKCSIPGPTCTDDQIRDLIINQNQRISRGKRLVWEQVDGPLSVDTFDDTFRLHISDVPTTATLSAKWRAIPNVASLAAKEAPVPTITTPVPGTDSGGAARQIIVGVGLVAFIVTVFCCCLVLSIAVGIKINNKRSQVAERSGLQACIDAPGNDSETEEDEEEAECFKANKRRDYAELA